MINTGITSFGYSTKVFHAPLIEQSPYFNLKAVVQRHERNATDFYPNVTIYESIDELLQDTELDLIIVNTPNQTHYDFAKRALLAGKHVIIDKPFAATAEECEELIELAKTQGKMLSVFQNRRWDGDFKIVKQVLAEGLIGELAEAEFKFDRFRLELNAKKHKELAEPATGLCYEIGTHLVDQALCLFGMPEAVFADIRKQRPHTVVDDYFEMTLFYPSFRLKLKSTLLAMAELPGYVLHGTKGSFIKKRMNLQEEQLKAGLLPGDEGYGREATIDWGTLWQTGEKGLEAVPMPTPDSNYGDYYELLGKHLMQGTPTPVDPQDSLNGIRLIEAAYQSSASRSVIELINSRPKRMEPVNQ